jgi:hypothetical protein
MWSVPKTVRELLRPGSEFGSSVRRRMGQQVPYEFPMKAVMAVDRPPSLFLLVERLRCGGDHEPRP